MKKTVKKNTGVVFTGYRISRVGSNTIKESGAKKETNDMFARLLSGQCPVSTSLCVVKKECFNKAGGFDELLSSFQDYDMWLRITQCGYEFKYIDKPLITKYEGHGDQISVNPERRYKGLCRIREKWMDALTPEQQGVFKVTLKGFEDKIKKNRIIYNKNRGVKCNYFALYRDYLKTDDTPRSKLKVFMYVLFGKNVLKFRKH